MYIFVAVFILLNTVMCNIQNNIGMMVIYKIISNDNFVMIILKW